MIKPFDSCWGLFIGINEYTDNGISNLTVCKEDIYNFYTLLTNHNFEKDKIKTLISNPSDSVFGSPSRANILSGLNSLSDSAGENDLLLFYFSGHGLLYKESAYLLPCDTRTNSIIDTAITIDKVKKIIKKSAAKAKVIIFDACHSGLFMGKSTNKMPQEFLINVFEEAEGLAILSSCKQDEVSWEWQDKKMSVFTYFLLEGLQGKADFEEKGFITLSDINRYLVAKVKNWAFKNNKNQTPTLKYEVVGDITLIIKNQIKEKQQKNSIHHIGEFNHVNLMNKIYEIHYNQPDQWINSSSIKNHFDVDQNDFISALLALKGKGLIKTKFIGDKSLVKITSTGVLMMKN